jgi:hypothetical protein
VGVITSQSKSAPLLKVLRRFLQFLQEIFDIFLSLGHDLFLRSSFPFYQFSHPMIICTHKGTFVLIYAIKAYKWSRGILPLIRNLSKFNSMPRPFYTPGNNFGTHWTGSWLGSGTGLDIFGEEKISGPRRVSNPDRPASSIVTCLLLYLSANIYNYSLAMDST